MDKLFSTFGDIGDSRAGGGDSFCDRLNCKFTVFVLIIFSLLVTTRMYVGDQVSCWCPPHFTSSHRGYTNQVSPLHDTVHGSTPSNRPPSRCYDAKHVVLRAANCLRYPYPARWR
ncbi:hypothetical protein NP493_1216g00035 [Ridgeia piscesae]|uniref:Uncharacterized protein n=1 Tax=Ridgeia piscesae TaxID=27915 RepID=A0AAD9KCK6_RIDPI|nr:hypothetical protein NP493_1216g00035 [Ridgeia piscesae]